ncbi:MAG TPA: GNAT family N-acetyltransferase [Candidatus Ornithomonoglobus intestinigallinarum]|jgi:putative acetyltransferase|uniref:GNAT family N-acetyltransferase n=1 Tax=Candidatus Ornithomonoglobus intestinigallinarum TaxID=2840894 RepID=A0A9D1KPV5_9FIRM|nr:GNAT family N-acetyltransferase [Candidatus Ornithomonoglobus intestinigallinarum]
MSIRRLEKSESYELLDLWMRSFTHGNSFIENDFWQKHYDIAKETYLNEKDNFVYTDDNGQIIGFICVDSTNSVRGVFVDPKHENRGIGTALMNYVKDIYTILRMNIYMKNKNTLNFATYHGFLIDGALRDPINGEIQYTMLWSKD